ncbi:hypothetical protein CR66_02755 [Campylobacter mucosalis]|uniref:hypothetical protein n=1 Tax=Campylobacter mucosalis TaxID=202 RepID=UPI0004DA4B1D|nr:hypothetical protein [Campylobacter mucosalis]KEA46146.1 hypothetical protein CR66_02755 [Campylobacter mucosalis]QKF62597.1 hypothetical protein CMCT_0431 [Campylobacter mucosalis]
MQLIGYDLVPYEQLNFIQSERHICANCLFKFDENLIDIAVKQDVEFSVICEDLSEAIIANATKAKFIICDTKNAKNFVKMAEFYMFDSKIACVIKDSSELEKLANLGVDTAIFTKGIKNGNF